MGVKISVPDRVADRVAALALAQGREVDDVATELIEAALPVDPEVEARVKRRFSFISIGDGVPDGSTTYKQDRRAAFARGEAADA